MEKQPKDLAAKTEGKIDEATEKLIVTQDAIATNALIADNQFGLLKETVGKKVTMQYTIWDIYSDEEPSSRSTETESFTLLGFNYVVDSRTGFKYLAFLRYGEGSKRYFPYHRKDNIFGDERIVTIENITDTTTKATIWSFARPNQPMSFKWPIVDKQTQRIEKFSESYDVFAKVGMLIENFINAEQAGVGYGWSEDDRKKGKQRLENAKKEIEQMIIFLGDRGSFIFLQQLGKVEQEVRGGYYSDVHRYSAEGQSDPNLGDFYDNEVRASSRGLAEKLRSIESVREFLNLLNASSTNRL